MKKIETYKRKSAMADLKDFCTFAMGPDDRNKGYCLEVTHWNNGEGFDVHIENNRGSHSLQFTWGEWEAMKKCIKAIEQDEN
jgi:hypothetical protein